MAATKGKSASLALFLALNLMLCNLALCSNPYPGPRLSNNAQRTPLSWKCVWMCLMVSLAFKSADLLKHRTVVALFVTSSTWMQPPACALQFMPISWTLSSSISPSSFHFLWTSALDMDSQVATNAHHEVPNHFLEKHLIICVLRITIYVLFFVYVSFRYLCGVK